MGKSRQKMNCKNSSNWLIIDMPATIWQILKAKGEQLPETENAKNYFWIFFCEITANELRWFHFWSVFAIWNYCATVNQDWKSFTYFSNFHPFTGHFEKHQPQLCPMHHSQSREEGRQDQRRTCLGPTPLQRCLGGNQNLPTRFPQQVIN